MITTPELIDSLAADLKPAPRRFVVRRLAIGIVFGWSVAAATMLVAWGLRPDFAAALASASFWLKLAYTGFPAMIGIATVWHLAHPDRRTPRVAWAGMIAVVLAMAALAGAQLHGAPATDYGRMLMGSTADVCPWLIAILAAPTMIGTFWALRRLAPTRSLAAGAATGLTAGASAAFIYAFSCDESALPFILVWYGAGMAIPTVIGAQIGRLALRW